MKAATAAEIAVTDEPVTKEVAESIAVPADDADKEEPINDPNAP